MRKCSSTILYAACTFRPYKSTPVLKLFRTFPGRMTRGLSLRMVFSLLLQDTLFQAEFGASLRDSSRVPRRRPFIYIKPTYAIGPVPNLSGHAIASRWRSLPRVRRHGASKPRGSSERVLQKCVTTARRLPILLAEKRTDWHKKKHEHN